MSVLSNIQVYGLDNAIKVSKYPMSVQVDALTPQMTKTVQKLGSALRDPAMIHF